MSAKDKVLAFIQQARELWELIPAPIRTIINVVVGAGIAAAITVAQSGGEVTVKTLWTAFLAGAGTAFWRAINPLDATYGLGRGTSNDPRVGQHELASPGSNVVVLPQTSPEPDSGSQDGA